MSVICSIIPARGNPAGGHRNFSRILLAVLGLALACPSVQAAMSVVGSKHDLSAGGPGPVKAVSEGGVCIFCHTPHGASSQAPLWNRYDSAVPDYTPYSSTTAKAKPDQPTGASKLCLSCHDGTLALGKVRSRLTPISMNGINDRIPEGRSNLGKNLSDDHPVSFVYNQQLKTANGELEDPSTLTGRVHLDRTGQMQCTACHDPHNNEFGKFLVVNNVESALCVTCHDKRYWSETIHSTSVATWDGDGTNPWPYTETTTVRANGCGNCHTSHKAGTPQRLLVFLKAEDNCLACHNGHVPVGKPRLNLVPEFVKRSRHDVRATDVHDPMENLINPATRHVECVDCHNPHAVKTDAAVTVPPAASGALAGVAGWNSAGASVDPVTYEYELCFRCHAESNGKGAAHVARQTPETDTRIEFDAGNESFHPIAAVGKNRTDVPSLISPWTVDSRMYCTDCHNNDQGPNAGGTGPNGPHGSIYEPLLERNLTIVDGAESVAAYALCYKCHSQNSILSDQSFPFHRKHVADAKTACTTCHDPHGVVGNKHLINFNTAVVTPSSGNILEYKSKGLRQGSCALTCHSQDHSPKEYGP